MNQLLKNFIKRSLQNNRSRYLTKNLKTVSTYYFHTKKATVFPFHTVCLGVKPNIQTHFFEKFRNYAKNSEKDFPSTIYFSKKINQGEGKRRKMHEAIEDRQRKLQRNLENAFQERKVSLTKARRKFQERSQLIIRDIKETKDKLKEKIEDVIERENVYTIPNLLCLTRIGLSPLLSYLIVSHKFEYALAFMVVAGVSDWIDGWIARNYKSQSSKLGSFLDPMADKVLIGTLFLSLTYVDLIPVPLTALIITRDVILLICGFVIRYQSLPPPKTLSRYFDVTHATAQLAPTFISKINTGVQLVLVGSALASPVFGFIDHHLLHMLWYATAATTVISASSYIFSKETYIYLKKQKKDKQ